MPIVTRQFAYVPRSRGGGRLRCREEHITGKGRTYYYPYSFTGDLAGATAAMNARDWDDRLIRDEVVDFEQHMLAGEIATTFVWADQTQTEGLRRFLRAFASTEDTERATPLAPIILGFTQTQIENNAGITAAQAQIVLDRANNLVTLATAQTDDFGEQQELLEEI